MAFIPRGGHWPKNAEEYPKRDNWLMPEQAAAYLGISKRTLGSRVREQVIRPIRKVWRYGCWKRVALFYTTEELDRYRVWKIAKRTLTDGLKLSDDKRLIAMNPLRRWRREQHQTALQVAKLFGVGEGTVAGWECGTRDPSPSYLTRIANLIEMDSKDLQMRWTAWKVLMLEPRPKPSRVQTIPDFRKKREKEETDSASSGS